MQETCCYAPRLSIYTQRAAAAPSDRHACVLQVHVLTCANLLRGRYCSKPTCNADTRTGGSKFSCKCARSQIGRFSPPIGGS